MTTQQLIAQGAEAKIFISNKVITKSRIKKSYRIPILDNKIRKLRTRAEAKILEKVSKIIPAPKPISSSEKNTEIKMPYIDGDKLSTNLNKFPITKQKKILNQIGTTVAKLHEHDIIHGDLTTSNMILKNNLVYFIDFGLSFQNAKYEDKAVDIHLLKQALEAKHFQNHEDLFKNFTKGYKWKDSDKILGRLKIVERRGRYKH